MTALELLPLIGGAVILMAFLAGAWIEGICLLVLAGAVWYLYNLNMPPPWTTPDAHLATALGIGALLIAISHVLYKLNQGQRKVIASGDQQQIEGYQTGIQIGLPVIILSVLGAALFLLAGE